MADTGVAEGGGADLVGGGGGGGGSVPNPNAAAFQKKNCISKKKNWDLKEGSANNVGAFKSRRSKNQAVSHLFITFF